GFCGTLAAVQLLRKPSDQNLRVVLIERHQPIGRGVAYGTAQDCHLLNVPAGRMSPLADDDAHFLNYLQRTHPEIDGGYFAPRRRYGEYLHWLLDNAERDSAGRHELLRVHDQAVDIENTPSNAARITLEGGNMVAANYVILASGVAGMRNPEIAAGGEFFSDLRYIADPWLSCALDRIDARYPVLLVGTGLTAVDIVISLRQRGFLQPIHALSRHGLLPIAHRASHHPLHIALPAALDDTAIGTRATLHILRRYVAEVNKSGTDWRDVMVALRPLTAQLWHKLHRGERARFLRHCQAYWEVFRHRLPPSVATELSAMLRLGALQIHAGRIAEIRATADTVDIHFLPRKSRGQNAVLRVGTVINCTGMSSNIRRSSAPLLQALQARGLIQSDAHGLGLLLDDNYAPIAANGTASNVLFYVGPLLKAQFWEATAVPELREHVQRLVDLLLIRIRADGMATPV
ncbi:MAG: FAD/NAD(P)-binding protein, partial [Spongiibacteraceae bacterium]